ncbi:acyl-CoA dehydrogenase family protein [[Eubacterium] cellulosolvens]
MTHLEAQKLLRKTFAKFANEELKPIAAELEEREEFPREIFKQLAKMGAFGIRYPKEAGCAGGGCTMFCIMCEELARVSMSVAAFTAMQCLMSTNFLFYHGSDELRERYFQPAMRGEKVGAFCLTEPDAGSDLANIRTIAERVRDEYVINGLKTWVTNGPYADMFTVLCQTDKSKGIRGVNFFFIPREAPGVSVSKKFDKLGTRATLIAELALEDVHIPLEHRLGDEGRGMANLMRILAEIRIMTAALSLGLARGAYEESFQYAKDRVQFNKPISQYQAIQMKIGTIATEIYASHLMTYDVTAMIDRGERCLKEASMAKLFVSEVACRAADEATRIFGAYSYANEYPANRFFRDTRFLLFGGGTSEILQTMIARYEGLF